MDNGNSSLGFEGIVTLALSDRIHHIDPRNIAERTSVEYVDTVMQKLGKKSDKSRAAGENGLSSEQ